MPEPKWIKNDFVAPQTRDLGSIRRVLIITMVLNFAATAVKLAAGILTGALSVVADGLDSLFDGLSNIIGLAGIYAASKPPDANHPYGHRKFETMAALSVAFLLFLTSWQLLTTAWERFWRTEAPQVNLWTGLAMLFAMLFQAATSVYELREGNRLRSEMLTADALHTRASVLVSASVLFGLFLIRLGFPRADPILAGFIALFIAKIGLDILRQNLPVLLDQAPFDPRRIAEVVEQVGGIESFHKVRSRGPLGDAAVDLHIRVSPEKSVQDANAIADEVRRRLLEIDGVADVTVHVEAQRHAGQEAAELIATVRHVAEGIGITVHEVWAHRIHEDLFLEIHVGVEPDLTLGEAHSLVDRLEREILARLPEVKGVHTHIELATKGVQVGGAASREMEGYVQQQVEQAVAGFPALHDPHNILVRRNPAAGDKIYLSLECTIAPDIPVTEAHYLASRLEQELASRLEDVADVSVHLEPPDER
jgi:cation diffusion facilitator family transporter